MRSLSPARFGFQLTALHALKALIRVHPPTLVVMRQRTAPAAFSVVSYLPASPAGLPKPVQKSQPERAI
jgi:hypothetical protein